MPIFSLPGQKMRVHFSASGSGDEEADAADQAQVLDALKKALDGVSASPTPKTP
jgi:hypothetical protein